MPCVCATRKSLSRISASEPEPSGTGTARVSKNARGAAAAAATTADSRAPDASATKAAMNWRARARSVPSSYVSAFVEAPKSTPASHSASETARRRDADCSNAREDSDASAPERELGPEPASAGGGAAQPPPASAAARAAGSSGSTSLSACAHAPSARPAFSFAASKFPSTSRAMSASTVAVTARDDSRRSSAPRGRLASGASLRGGSSASGSGKAFEAFGTLERPSANARAATSRVTADANASARGAPRAPSAYDAARAASASISPFPSRSISAISRSSEGNVPKPRSVPSASARRRDRGFEAAEAATRSEQNVLSESV